jgi:two-component system, response regulator PdtaR
VTIKKRTILLAEDEAFIRFGFAMFLEDMEFDVLQAASAVEAMEMIQTHPQIELLFTDIRMPGTMDGLDLARWVGEQYPKILVMIASGDFGRAVTMEQLRAARTFHKPYDYQQVADSMMAAIDVRRSE